MKEMLLLNKIREKYEYESMEQMLEDRTFVSSRVAEEVTALPLDKIVVVGPNAIGEDLQGAENLEKRSFNTPSGREASYWVLPRAELSKIFLKVLGQPKLVQELEAFKEEKIMLHVSTNGDINFCSYNPQRAN